MKIVMLTMVSLKIAKSVSMLKEVMVHAMVILVLLMPLPELVTSEIGLGKRLEFNLIYYPKQMF